MLTPTKNGISYSIFESDPTILRRKSREWGMSIHWARDLLKALLPDDLHARLREAQVDPSYDASRSDGYQVPFYNGKTGEHIVDIPMVNAIRVSRRKMRALCAEGIDIQVRFAADLQALMPASSFNCIHIVRQESCFFELHAF